jgi:hypothetical protein
MRCSTVVYAVVIVVASAVALPAQRMLLDQRYLNEFPTVERIKAEMKGSDEVETYALVVAAVSVINQFMINDLARAPNGGMYTMPPAADRVHDRYRVALTYYEIDNPDPIRKDARYRSLRDKYENDPAFADWLLQRFFSPQFRADYYAWTRKPVPPQSAESAIGAGSHSASGTARPKADTPKRVQCARVSVSGPTDTEESQPITFTALVTGGDPDMTVTYNWTLSAGTISSGQGTSSITVDTTGIGGVSATATVQIGGMDRDCSNSASSTTVVRARPQPRKFDEFGTISIPDQLPRLDNLAIQMQYEPPATVYIIAYAGRRSVKGSAAASLTRMKSHLVKTRGIDAARIVTVDGGYRELPTTEFWIVPDGASPPQPSPTVAPSEIGPSAKTKPAAKKKPRSR